MARECRDWSNILVSGLARGLTPIELAREQRCDSAAVYWAEKQYKITLLRKREQIAPTYAAPFDPAATEWRAIPGYEGLYEASTAGSIRSAVTGQERKQRPHKIRGYMLVGLSRDGKQKELRVHRLVAMAFVSNPHGHPHVNHLNCNKLDNTAANLEWASFDDNFAHGRAAGRALAAHNPRVRHKLSANDVLQIRNRRAAGESVNSIARDFPQCNPGHISKISRGKSQPSVSLQATAQKDSGRG